MSTFYNIDQNIYYAILLVIVMVMTKKNLPHKSRIVGILNIVAIISIICTVTEAITEYILIDVKEVNLVSIILLHIITIVTALCASFLTLAWLHFIIFYLNRYKVISFKKIIIMAIPFLITCLIILPTYFTKTMTDIVITDTQIIYNRGCLYNVVVFIEMGYIVAAAVYIIMNKKDLTKKEFTIFMLFEILPIIGTSMQMIHPHLLYIFPTSTFTIILAYILLKDRLCSYDIITGALTPRAFSKIIFDQKTHQYNLAFINLKDYLDIRKKFGKLEQELYLKRFSDIVIANKSDDMNFIYISDSQFAIYFPNYDYKSSEEFMLKLKEEVLKFEKEKNKNKFNIKFDYVICKSNIEKNNIGDPLKEGFMKLYEKLREEHYEY